MNKLDELIKDYYNTKQIVDELTKRKEQLGSQIKELLTQENLMDFTSQDGYKAKITERVTFKYEDEGAILNYLIQRGLSDAYLVKKIDTVKFNKELKAEGKVYEAVKSYITKTVSNTLNVEEA